MTDLLSCPFCEGNAHLEPELYSDENPNEVIGPASVNCQNCGAAIWGDWSDDAIAAWNRRHLSATVPAGDGELVERVARAIAQADEQNGKEPVVKRLEWIDMGEGPRCITVCGASLYVEGQADAKPIGNAKGVVWQVCIHRRSQSRRPSRLRRPHPQRPLPQPNGRG